MFVEVDLSDRKQEIPTDLLVLLGGPSAHFLSCTTEPEDALSDMGYWQIDSSRSG